MAVIKWQLNYVSCNFGLKSYLRVWNHACHFRLNCTPLCSIMIINRSCCAKSAIKATSPVKTSEKLRPTCLLSHMRSWFFLFEILQYIRHQKYMTQMISRPSRFVPRPYWFFFRGERERAASQKNVWDQDIRSHIKIPEDWMLLRAKDFTFTTTESSFCPKSQRIHSFFVFVGIDCLKNTNISRTNTK